MKFKLIYILTSCVGILLLSGYKFAYSKNENQIASIDSLLTIGQYDSSMHTIDDLLKKAEYENDTFQQAQILFYKAKTYENNGQFEEAYRGYFNAIPILKASHQKLYEGLCYTGLSNVNFRMGNYEHALENGIIAARIFDNFNDTANYIQANIILSQAYIAFEKFNDSKQILIEALSLAKKTNNKKHIAFIYNNLGAIHTLEKNYDQALDYQYKALKINQILGERINYGINLANIGEIELYKGNYNIALEYLLEALAIEKEYNCNSCLIFINYKIGEAHSLLKNAALSMHFFNLSLDLIDSTGENREKPTVYNLISEHYERNKNYNQALEFHKKYGFEKDKLNTQTTIFKIDELRIIYDVEKKEQQLKEFTLEKKIQDHELESNKKLIKLQLLALILVICGFFSMVIFSIYFIKSRQNLKQLNRTKDLLFSIIGHDLRGPMGNIKQVLVLLNGNEIKDQKKYLNMLETQASSAYNLLEDLLSWSQSIKNNLDFRPSLISAKETVTNTLLLFKSLASEKFISIESFVSKDVIVYGDLNQFSTIFRNLISNAIKYTPNGGSITIYHEVENKFIRFYVKDTGLGIEPQNIEKIMDKNTFFSTFGTNNEKGSGLGLVLCNEFIKKNGGTFHVTSKIGKGTTISFTFPHPKN